MIDYSMDTLEASRKIFSEPNFTHDFSDYGQILNIHLSPFEWSQDIILIVFENKIVLAQLLIDEIIEVNTLNEFVHPGRCTALSLSPETSLSVLPSVIQFCTGSNDFKIRHFNTDAEGSTCRVLNGHSSYINDVMFEPQNLYIASVSDDNTCKVWSCEDYSCKTTYVLSSPGMVVSWHRADGYKLLVAEKSGILRFYNVETETPIISLDYCKPLSNCHWCPADNQMLATLQLGELLVWDLTNPCLPIHSNILFPETGGSVKFSPHGELIAAVNSVDSSLKILHVKSQAMKLTAKVTLPTNVGWHFRLPLVCLGDDMKLCFWKVTAK